MSSETIDPLALLREFVIKNFKITLKDGYLIFDQGQALKLPLETPTAWKMKSQGGKNFCTLGSLWCLIVNRDLKAGEYMKKAGEIGVQSISLLEKNEVVQYFTGVKQESDMLDI